MIHDWRHPLTEPLMVPRTEDEWRLCLADPWWRICSGVLYKIMVKGDDQDEDSVGDLEPFLPNVNQLRFMENLHFRNSILKARQLGFTTCATIMGLDRALFTKNQRCGIIAHEKDKASEILRDKVIVAYENLPPHLLAKMPTLKRSETEIQFAHNKSSIRVSTSMRGGTIHFLHISELGKIAAKYPAKAREIRTGSLPAVPKSGIWTIESTAEGAEGMFHEISTRAEAKAIAGKILTPGDVKHHFFPWFLEPGYRVNPEGIAISLDQHEYFDGIEEKTGIAIELDQRAWYVSFLEENFGGDWQMMMQEMPSIEEEAWSRSTEGTFYTPQLKLARAEKRIGKVPYIPSLPVHTFWDIGAGDGTGIWLGQQVGLAMHMIGYIENWSKGYDYYVRKLRERQYVYGRMLLPHDAAQQRQLETKIGSPIEMLHNLAPDWKWEIVPRVHDFSAGIHMMRSRFGELWFDEVGCKEGLQHLALYKKKYNTRTKTFTDDPEKHDGHSEAADSLRQWAQGFAPSHATGRKAKPARRASGMTA